METAKPKRKEPTTAREVKGERCANRGCTRWRSSHSVEVCGRPGLCGIHAHGLRRKATK